MKHTLGIDAGSSYIKMVLIDAGGRMAGKKIFPRGAEIDASCRRNYDDLLASLGVEKDYVERVIATGYGRKQISFADEIVTEITALAVGAFAVDHGVRTIIDVGGQDSKVVAVDESGKVVDFVMNQKCSAGTGKFLEVTSGSLGVKVEKLGELSLKADKAMKLSSTCTVFAESEIISCIAAGEKKENILKALHNTISGQIMGLYYQANSDHQGKVFFAGGVALNEGMVAALRDRLNREIIVPPDPQFIGAWGAALFKRKTSK